MHDIESFSFLGMTYESGGIFMLIFWVLVIMGILVLLQWRRANITRSGGDLTKSSPQTAEDTLLGRYARGEVDRDGFLLRLADLNASRSSDRKSSQGNSYNAGYVRDHKYASTVIIDGCFDKRPAV